MPKSSRSETSLAAVRIGLIAVVASIVACGDPPTRESGHPSPLRLVDPIARTGALVEPASMWSESRSPLPKRADSASTIPRATIRDDTRYVLATHPHFVLAAREYLDPVARGHVRFSRALEGRFEGATRLFIDAQVEFEGEDRWRDLPSFVAPIRSVGGEPGLVLDLNVPEAKPGRRARLWIEAIRAPDTPASLYRTRPLAIPAQARIEFAIGILDAALDHGKVRFRLSACGDSRAAGESDGSCEVVFDDTLDPRGPGAAGWQDRAVSLEAYAGQTRTLRFETIALDKNRVSLPVWGNPTVISTARAASAEEPAPPNVILVSIDTLRRDHLDLYGHERATSPFLSEILAPQGVVFDDLVAEAATTDPSHMTLFTSLPALVHGAACCHASIEVAVPSLAESFRAQGFATAALTENGPLDHMLGYAIGFDRWVENKSVGWLLPIGQIVKVLAQARHWIDHRTKDRPFFLFLHTYQVHGLYTPEGPYLELFAEDEPAAAPGAKDALDYDREIRFVDDQIALFYRWLEGRGLTRNTILLILADHGEEFFEHGSLGHGTLPFEQVLGIPLIVAGPGIAKGLRDSRPLHHVDIMPTLLELAGIPIPEHAQGVSFAAALRGRGAPSPEAERVRISASWVLPEGIEAPAETIRRGDLKVIRFESEGEVERLCFDVRRDPLESRDICNERADDVAELLAILDENASRAASDKRALAEAALPADPGARSAPLDPDRESELRALGYID